MGLAVIFRRRDRAWRKQRREFVYLDEVSVISLVAARDGSIAESIKHTLTSSSEAESKSTLGLDLKGLKLGSESRVRAAETSAKEVVRKAVIQSTFRDLRTGGDGNDIHLVRDGKRTLRTIGTQSIGTIAELKRAKKKLVKGGQLLSVAEMSRGDVLELEIKIEADKTYRFVSAISSIVEIVKDREELFEIDKSTYDQIVSITEVIDRLLVGLVPIRGRSTRFGVIEIDGVEHLVDQTLLREGSDLQQSLHPLEVVGVTDFTSYSKDLRRVLFNDATYTAYMRVETPSLCDTWNPIKLSGVLRTLSVDIDTLIKDLPDRFELPPASQISSPRQEIDATSILAAFGENLAAELGLLIDRTRLEEAATNAAVTDILASVESRRHAFDLVVDAIDPDANRETVRRLREDAMTMAYASASGQVPDRQLNPSMSSTEKVGRKIEVEFVAIYW